MQTNTTAWQTKQRAAFRRIFEEANKIGAHVVIAGGAAVDVRRASDIDVFVLGQMGRGLGEDCDTLIAAFGGSPLPAIEQYVPADRGRGEFYRAGKAEPDWSPLPIHVIGWRSEREVNSTPIGLLETFDLSIHAWAIDDTGRLIGCDNSTGASEPIRICNDTPTTGERLVKLTQRYFPSLEHARVA